MTKLTLSRGEVDYLWECLETAKLRADQTVSTKLNIMKVLCYARETVSAQSTSLENRTKVYGKLEETKGLPHLLPPLCSMGIVQLLLMHAKEECIN